MEGKRKMIDKYVEGEHKWFGCTETSTMVDSLSMYPGVKPWYLSETTLVLNTTAVSRDTMV